MRILFSSVLALALVCGLFVVPNAAADDNDKYTTYRGCLAGTHDNYILKEDSTGKLFRLHSDKDINEHVGNVVEVRGRIDNKKQEKEAKVQDNAAQQAGVEVPTDAINVEDVKDVSKGCGAAAAPSATMPEQSTQPVQPQQ